MKGWNENYARGLGKWQNLSPEGPCNPLDTKAPENFGRLARDQSTAGLRQTKTRAPGRRMAKSHTFVLK